MAVSCIVSEISKILVKNRDTPAFDAPVRGSPSECCQIVWYTEKLEWCDYPKVKTNVRICSAILTEDRRTDKRTDILR